MPYLRDDAPRPALGGAGHPGPAHRIGGLEKEDVTGNISYQPENHDHMTRLRAERIARVEVPDLEVDDPRRTPRCWCSAGGRATGRSRAAARASGASMA